MRVENKFSDIADTVECTYKEFPRMLFHPIEGEKIVKDEEEMSKFLKVGWKREQIAVSEEEKIVDKIAWHKAEIIKLEDKLSDLRGFDEVANEDEEEEDEEVENTISVSVTEEKVEVGAEEQPPVSRRVSRRVTQNAEEEGGKT